MILKQNFVLIYRLLSEATRESFVVTFLSCDSGISLFSKSKSHTFSLWKRDGWGLSVTDNEDVDESSGEGVALCVLDVDNIVRTDVLLNALENTDSSNVVTSSKGDSGALNELDNTVDLLGGEVELD